MSSNTVSNITKFGVTHGNRTLAQILADEQARYARLGRVVTSINVLARREDLAFASPEERAGASLLREVINQMDIVHQDEEQTIMRVILNNGLVDRLEWWGVDNCDFEDGYDGEAEVLVVPAV